MTGKRIGKQQPTTKWNKSIMTEIAHKLRKEKVTRAEIIFLYKINSSTLSRKLEELDAGELQ